MFKVVKLNFTVHGVRFFIERLHCWFQETEDASSISVDVISSDLILTSICFYFLCTDHKHFVGPMVRCFFGPVACNRPDSEVFNLLKNTCLKNFLN